MPKALVLFVISFGIISGWGLPSKAEYFSNMGGGKTAEVQQASSKAFAGLAQLMTGLSTLELANDAEAKTHLATAVTTMKAAAGEFQALAEKNANVTLEVKFPDALAELAQTLEVSPEKIATVGDVLALTSQSLATTTGALEKFAIEPSSDHYTTLRKTIEDTLRAGDLSSKLLK